jgi:hypothetical protein
VTATACRQIVLHGTHRDICGSLPANAMFMRRDSSIALTGKFSNVFCSGLLPHFDEDGQVPILSLDTVPFVGEG